MTGSDLPRILAIMAALGLTGLVLAAVSVSVGYLPIPPADLFAALFDDAETPVTIIAREIRLPRALLAILVGAVMALSGAAMQGLLRNPLADPGVIGVSATAGLGAVGALYFGSAAASIHLVAGAGMAGALLAVVLVVAFAGRQFSTVSVILAGIALNATSISLTSMLMVLSPNPWVVTEMLHWLLGSLADRSMRDVWLVLPFMLAGGALLLGGGRALDALTLGEDSAVSMGFDLGLVRLRLILGTALAVGSAVSVVGSVGFVGLVVPHLLRPLVHHRPSALLWVSMAGGAVLVLAADIAIRLLATNPEMQLGVLTGAIGGPFFLLLILRTRTQMA